MPIPPECPDVDPAALCDQSVVLSGWCDSTGAAVDVIYSFPCAGGAPTITYYSPTTGLPYVPVLPLQQCNGGAADFEQLAICDVNPIDGQVIGVYIVRTVYDPATNTFTVTNIDINTGLPYVPTGVPRFCGDSIDVEQAVVCVVDVGVGVPFKALLHTQYLAGGIIGTYLTQLDQPATAIPGWGTTVIASDGCVDPERPQHILCDDNGPFIRQYTIGADGTFVVFDDFALDGTPYAAVGNVTSDCTPGSVSEFVLCDDAGPFIRKYIQDATGTVTATVDLGLTGNPYIPVGIVKRCCDTTIDIQILCDVTAGVATQFLRRYSLSCDSNLPVHIDTTLDGVTPYVTAGIVSSCDAPTIAQPAVTVVNGIVSRLEVTAAGAANVAAGKWSVAFTNAHPTTVSTVAGVNLQPFESVKFIGHYREDTREVVLLPQIAYNANAGSRLHIVIEDY